MHHRVTFVTKLRAPCFRILPYAEETSYVITGNEELNFLFWEKKKTLCLIFVTSYRIITSCADDIATSKCSTNLVK